MKTQRMFGLFLVTLLCAAACAWAELCPKCKDGTYTMDSTECSECKQGWTASGRFKLCRDCSTKLGQCEHCRAALADKAAAVQAEKRELLSRHETIAVFSGVSYHECMGLTSRCPKDCGSSGEYALFTINKYLKYEKPGKYGDPEQKEYSVQVSDYYKKPIGDPKIRALINSLKKGDEVRLSWNHDYVTKDGSSSPERPIVKLEKITTKP